VFNGVLSSSVTSGGHTTNTWHLDAPAASYLTTLAIGPYTRTMSTTPSGMTIEYWLQPRDAHLLADLEREGSASFEWLQAHAGSYPFSSLGIVVVGGASAMETETMITMSRSAVNRSDAVLEHEMAHQWYGDSLTPRDWQDLWLSEGWAMYMQQWYERDSHRRVYGGGISHWRGLDQASRNRSGPPGDYRPSMFADTNVYLSPAMMLDAIRQRIGDAAFDDLAKAWPAEHRDSNVSRAVFARWLRQYTGVGFTGLMHRWLDSTRTPPAP
jgi:aminopeptidase N